MSEPAVATKKGKSIEPPPAEMIEISGDTTVAEDVIDRPVETKPREERGERLERAPTSTLSAPLKKLNNEEDVSLAAWFRNLGMDEGNLRVGVYRVEPESVYDPQTGRSIKCDGHLKNYSKFVDEEFLAEKHGGGTLRLRIQRQNEKGTYVYVKSRDVQISGDPKIESLHRNLPPASSAPQQPQNGDSTNKDLVKQTFDVLKDELNHARNKAATPAPSHDPSGTLDAIRLAIEPLQAQLALMSQQLIEKDKIIAQANQRPAPVEDPFKATMLEHMMKDGANQVQMVRVAYEAEIRALKEGHNQDIARAQDRWERERQYITMQHEREIAGIKQSHEISLAAVKGSFDTQTTLLQGTIRSLERENDSLRSDVKELRAKKEKTIIESAKELEAIRDVVGGGEEKSVGAKILDVVTDPNAWEAVGSIVNRNKPQAGQPGMPPGMPGMPPGMPPQQMAPQRPSIIKGPDGQRYVMHPNGQITGPVKKKKKVSPTGEAEPELPEIDPGTINQVVTVLENAFSGNQPPEIVAQSFSTMIPEEIKMALRDHGVDVFMSKVAKLQSGSPLSTQAGRNWLRKVSEALLG